ncbi:MAG: 2-C-methyl-D-erythritol 2,4-cyclodiphosphate synthase [Phycisphaerales bacterium]
MASPDLPFRIGHGYDLHRLEPHPPLGKGRRMIVGGVVLPDPPKGAWREGVTGPVGPVGHSDGDVLYHAVTDALLGAIAQQDIGQLFPDSAAENEGRNSEDFLAEAMRRVKEAGYRVGNLDCTVVLERPKLAPHKAEIRANLARVLEARVECVNLKGKTHEKVDAVGEGRAIEAHAVVLLVKA